MGWHHRCIGIYDYDEENEIDDQSMMMPSKMTDRKEAYLKNYAIEREGLQLKSYLVKSSLYDERTNKSHSRNRTTENTENVTSVCIKIYSSYVTFCPIIDRSLAQMNQDQDHAANCPDLPESEKPEILFFPYADSSSCWCDTRAKPLLPPQTPNHKILSHKPTPALPRAPPMCIIIIWLPKVWSFLTVELPYFSTFLAGRVCVFVYECERERVDF